MAITAIVVGTVATGYQIYSGEQQKKQQKKQKKQNTL